MIYLITEQTELFDQYSTDLIRKVNVEKAREALKGAPLLALDTETKGLDPFSCELLCTQLSDGGSDQYVIDNTTVPLKAFKDIIEESTIIGHNLNFDLRFLFHHGVYPMQCIDTFLQESVLTTGLLLPKGYRGLASCADRYLKVQLDKSVRGHIHREGLSTRVVVYAADDVKYLHKLHEAQSKALEKQDLLRVANLENKFVVPMTYMSHGGIHLDQKKWREKMVQDKINLSKAIQELNDYVLKKHPTSQFISYQGEMFNAEGEPADGTEGVIINWGSDQQVKMLFKGLGIDTLNSKTKKHTVELKFIMKFAANFPILNLYEAYSKAAKVVSTYGENYLEYIKPLTGRIHSSFRQIKDTGRISSDDPNIQNLPADHTRKCFTAEAGNVIVGADYSGQETRVLADMSRDREYLAYVNDPTKDIHCLMAQAVYPELRSLTHQKIKALHPEKRQFVKPGTFAIPYGGNGKTIADNLGIAIEVADAAYKYFMDKFPGLKSYFKKAADFPLKHGYVLINSKSGRRSFLGGYDKYLSLKKQVSATGFWERYRTAKAEDNFEFQQEFKPLVKEYFQLQGTFQRKGLNFPIQGTAADMTKLAAIYVMRWIQENDYINEVKIVVMAHDEIQLECPAVIQEQVKVVLKDCMENAAARFCESVPIPADAEIANHWKK